MVKLKVLCTILLLSGFGTLFFGPLVHEVFELVSIGTGKHAAVVLSVALMGFFTWGYWQDWTKTTK